MIPSVALEKYPKTVSWSADQDLEIRPLQPNDKVRLLEFFRRVPEDDRYYLRDSVASPEVVHRWTDNIDLNNVIPLVAIHEGRIVADSTLHVSQIPARRHIGELRIVVDVKYRGMGLGGIMIGELISVAEDIELETLVFELVVRREAAAFWAAHRADFNEVAQLRNRIKDAFGAYQDIAVFELQLKSSTELFVEDESPF